MGRGVWQDNLLLSTWYCKMATVKSLKADVSSISPMSEQNSDGLEKLGILLKASFLQSHYS